MKEAEEMALSHVLIGLDIATLLLCTCVSKSWRALVRSPIFQSQWLATHEKDHHPLVLVTVAHNRDTLCPPYPLYVSKCSLANPRLSPPLNIHIPGFSSKPFEILASSSGLLLACLVDLDDWWLSKFCLAVGNPVTDEWINLPSPVPSAISTPSKELHFPFHFELDYQFRVDATTGHFSVTVTQLTERDIRACYDSKLGSWSRIHHPRNVDTPGMVSLFDVDGVKEWSEFQVPELDSSLRIEVPTTWSYNANRYVAGLVRSADTFQPTHYSLWKEVSKKRLEKVFMSDMFKEVVKNSEYFWDSDDVQELVLSFQGDGKLLCVAAWFSCRYWPPSVYDMSSGDSFHFDAKCLIALGCIHFKYTRAAVYRPSLLKPASSASRATTCPPPDMKPYRSTEDVVSYFWKNNRGKRPRYESDEEDWTSVDARSRTEVTQKKHRCNFCDYSYVQTTKRRFGDDEWAAVEMSWNNLTPTGDLSGTQKEDGKAI